MKRPARTRVTNLPYCRWRWTAEQRFDHFTKVDPVSGCLIWQASLAPGGYGQLTFRNRSYLAHRLAWIVKNGPIPAGLNVCHRCDERRCVNTDHLFLGTHSANMLDMREKKRAWYGSARANSKRATAKALVGDLAPIRVLYRGIEFVGKAIARPIDPNMPMPAPAARRAPARARRSRTRGSRGARSARRSGGRS